MACLMPQRIHRVGDGLPARRIYLDGVELKNVVYANTETGDVTFAPLPLRVQDGEVFYCTKRGVVTVEFM